MIKRRLIMAAAAFAVGTAAAGAQDRHGPPVPGARVLPAHEIVTILRSTGFDPVSRPVQLGSHYEVQAIDPDDFDVRLLVDGRTGRVLTVRDSEDMGRIEPPFPPDGYQQAAGRFGPLSYGPVHGRIAPPRGVPASRPSATLEPPRAPVPRPRPEARGKPAIASTAPVAPTATGASPAPSAANPASTVPSAANPASTVPNAANAGVGGTIGATPGKNETTATTAANTQARNGPPAPDAASAAKATDPVKILPVAPLE